jgi:hypothetical protein
MRSNITLASTALLALVVCLLPAASATAQVGSASYDTYGDDAGYYGNDVADEAGYDGSYTYVRTIDGAASLTEGDTGDRDDVTVNQPVLVGDRVWVAPTGRLELVLSDGNKLRVDGGSELTFERIATSPDRDDTETVLRLLRGNVQLVVVEGFLGDSLPRIDTPNAALYAREPGDYRVTTAGGDWTQSLVRRGSLDVVTRDGSTVVRADEEALVEGGETRGRAEISLARAGRADDLELWGQGLDRSARVASASRYLDDSLSYRGSRLDDHGTWVDVEGSYAWRPTVSVSWRPYWDGRWRYTRLGYTWVSHEPWGWVPYHYGTWDYVPSYGWVWFPGRRFAPAWVYWHWTDSYAAWVPVGYYSRYYPRGLRYGVYGWAGGSWNHYDRWNFCPRTYVGHRGQRRWHRDADHYRRETRWATPRRGILTTDTRGLTPDRVRRGDIAEAFRGRGGAASTRGRTPHERVDQLPDVTTFVARERMPENVQNRIVSAGRGLPGEGRAANVRGARDEGSADGIGSTAVVRKPAMVGERGDRDGVATRDNRTPRATAGGSSDGVTSAGRGEAVRSRDRAGSPSTSTARPERGTVGDAWRTTRPRTARPEATAPARGAESSDRSAEPSRRPATVKPPAQRVMDGVRSRSPRTGAGGSGAETRPRATEPTQGTSRAGGATSRTETRRPRTVRPPASTQRPSAGQSSAGSSTSRSRARAAEPSRPPSRATSPPRSTERRATAPRSTERRSSAGSGSSRSSSTERSSAPSRRSSSASSGSSSSGRSSGAARSRGRGKKPPAV